MVHYIMFLNMYSRFWHNKCLFCFYLYSVEKTLPVPSRTLSQLMMMMMIHCSRGSTYDSEQNKIFV